MKFAIWKAADQTIGYFTDDTGCLTTEHPKAKLWDAREGAESVVAAWNDGVPATWEDGLPRVRERSFAEVEEVPDEAEFCAREDAW